MGIIDRILGRNRPEWPELTIDEIRKRARILVVDDQAFPYEKLFARDGYTLKKWDDVTNLTDLEEGQFDLILLDLQGVGKAESADEGLGVLRHIRTQSPAQIIIAYSNADWPLKNQPFFQMADATLQKSADYVDFKRAVDELLIQRFSLGFYVSRIQRELAEHSPDGAHLDRIARESILTGRPERLSKYLHSHVADLAAIDRALQIANIAVGIANLTWHPHA